MEKRGKRCTFISSEGFFWWEHSKVQCTVSAACHYREGIPKMTSVFLFRNIIVFNIRVENLHGTFWKQTKMSWLTTLIHHLIYTQQLLHVFHPLYLVFNLKILLDKILVRIKVFEAFFSKTYFFSWICLHSNVLTALLKTQPFETLSFP